MKNAGLMKHKLESRCQEKYRYHHNGGKQRWSKEPFDEVERDLKLKIQEMKIMASDSITSWQIDGETMETVTDFCFGGSKITADRDHSHQIKRDLLLGRKATTNLDSISKSRDVTLPTKVCLLKAMVFPVVMYGCESWPYQKLSTKKLMLLNCGVGELLRVSWTARRSNQSILKEISPGCSLEGLVLKL